MIFPPFSSDVEDTYSEIVRNNYHTICLTSANAGEGVSSLAHSLTQRILLSGESALLVDLNMKLPATKKLFSETTSPESHAMLPPCLVTSNEDETIFQCAQPKSDLASIVKLKHPGEIQAQLSTWLQSFDYVIVDCPCVLGEHEHGLQTELIAQTCDATLMIALAQVTTESHIEQAVRKLRSENCNLAGLVLNDRFNPSLREELIRQIARLNRFTPHPLRRLLEKVEQLVRQHTFFSIET